MERKFTKNLESRLLKYTAAAGAVVGVGAVNAQVVYTDVDPDLVITGHQQGTDIDLDNDGTNDFSIATLASSYTTYYSGYGTLDIAYAGGIVVAETNNSWLGVASGTSTSASIAPAALAAGVILDGSASSWQSGQGSLGIVGSIYVPAFSATIPIDVGNWAGTTDGYLGVAFDISGTTHYGWVRMDLSSDGTSLTLKDYAYESFGGWNITTGEMGTVGIQEELDAKINITSTLDKVVIENFSNVTNGSIQMVSLSGQVVKTANLNDQREVIATQDLSAGIYIVNVTFAEGTVTKKVYLR